MTRLTSVTLLTGLAVWGLVVGIAAAPRSVPAPGGIIVTSVVDYGAVPDDDRDDTKAISAAIAAAMGSSAIAGIAVSPRESSSPKKES